MAKLLQIRRGTTSQHSGFTGAEGEITVDTDKDTIVVHDNSTAGGIPLATQAGLDAIPVFDDNVIQTNIALLAFKTAVNGSLAKYNLQDQVIDEYTDGTGIDSVASANNNLGAGAYLGSTTPSQDADVTGVDGLYTWYKWTDSASTGYFNTVITHNIDYIVVAGGGAGGSAYGGGGGAGGFKTAASLSVSADNHTITVGAGGAIGSAATSAAGTGTNGGDSSIAALVVSTGGGAGGAGAQNGEDGGSGGGGGGDSYPGGDASPTGHGYDGGNGYQGDWGIYSRNAGGGGGATEVGDNTSFTAPGHAGDGENNVMAMSDADSDAFLTTVSAGHDVGGTRFFSGGGGGGGAWIDSVGNPPGTGGDGGDGGGGAGVGGESGSGSGPGNAALANTGGGGGGGGAEQDGWNNVQVSYVGGAGGSGVVILKTLTSAFVTADLTLQSVDTEAETQPTKADMVMLMEDSIGTATLNSDIKGYISRDSGTTFTQGTLVDEGDWGTNKRILTFHDLDISGQPADKTMCYKITTHNQDAALATKVHATSMGWR
jgi:hypothetical protein